ncbi:MAG TPA: ATP-grasp domain-containing protein, partial [Candidatus Limnocylindria bacterium]
AGLTFIGPSPESIRKLGDKIQARQLAQDLDIPLAPGGPEVTSIDNAFQWAEKIGYPVMVKAAAGGGGRGIRLVERPDDFHGAAQQAMYEAQAAFGNPAIYVEKYFSPVRHIEIQVIADKYGNVVPIGERECSIQRRHQKLIEESPSVAVTPYLRRQLGRAAVRIARAANYHNVGTVEFLLTEDGNYYFLEMNTRLQVEHGVTELVTGLDLVAWQIRVAAGERLPADVVEATRHGHAIEVRLYAEDPYDGFRPTSGRIGAWRMPEGPGVRVDAGLEEDTDLRPEYDPLLAKLMVHAADRTAAIDRLRRALDETIIGGLQTDAGFLRWLVDDDAFASGAYDTSLIAERWRGGPALGGAERALVALAATEARLATSTTIPTAAPTRSGSPWGDLARREGLR